MEAKICSKCKEEKSVSDFYIGRKQCKKCLVEREAQYYSANKEKIAEQKAQYRSANKEKIAEQKAQHYSANKEKIAEQKAQYYSANKEKIAEQKAQYYSANKEKIAERQAQYRSANKEKIAEQKAQYYSANKEKIAEQKAQYYSANKEKLVEREAQYRSANKEKIAERQAQYRSANKEKIAEQKAQYVNKRLKTDPRFKLDIYFSRSIRDTLKNINSSKNGRSWESLVGYSAQQLKEHLEKQFKPEMNWENHGTYWHIDHKRPKSWFNYDSAEHPDFKQCWALENLQPLEATENMKKSNKFEG